MIHFDLPKEKSSIIKVIGIGGGGSNAVNHMYNQRIDGVNFIICNTDAQAIANSPVPNKVQLGPHLTQGLGAGANPKIGEQATEESFEEIKKILEVNTKMAFITAGMGGGTGTGGAPIIAKICKELGILTVGIVTTPFSYEGKKRMLQADEGVNRLKEYVDTLLIISNDKLRQKYGDLKFKAAFEKADNILATAAKCITDVINSTGQINVDFADVCTVMRNGGVAILGAATAEGENRAQKAIEEALTSPLLNDNDIRGAKWILINISSSEGEFEHTLDEMDIIQAYVQSQSGEDCDVILGVGYDQMLDRKLGVTIIATGFEQNPIAQQFPMRANESQPASTLAVQTASVPEMPQEPQKILMTLGTEGEEKKMTQPLQVQASAAPDAMAPRLVEPVQQPPASQQFYPVQPVPVNPIQRANYNMDIEPIPNPVPPTQQSNISVTPPTTNTTGNGAYVSGFTPKPGHTYIAPADNTPADSEPRMEMVFRDETPAPPQQPQQPVSPAEDMMMDEQKRKQAERVAKLRSISFNVKNMENNQEIENVPAYIRRNVEIQNAAAAAGDNLYSNYTVNNQAEINTINTFLDGKKPD
ncbi:cell division protein FtsZ [Chitinophaga costaii]|uniref:Cell division protein FtsZ n=1 Tax=Chitinophaga costaii TaxID=1335309 RepID=A0A1C4BTD0_9BACT|nr:cell division protein FtsZ [Chitinophaga costaii]PUZ27478.1 cell division protein FtsZ [Chitinophaga costaii]SCC10171.1 cell division protein FtsZ [Chitinophaga costaii]